MQNNGQKSAPPASDKPMASKELRNLARFLSAWCDTTGVQPAELADRADAIKQKWIDEKRLSQAEIKRFGSSRPHFYRLLKGQVQVEIGDNNMLQYLSEIFEIDVVQLFDNLADRVWPTVHLAPSDYIEAPLQDALAKKARYLFPMEHLAGCPMHHLYLELGPGGSSGMHRHISGTEMMRLDTGEAVTLRFPTRAKNRREIALGLGEAVFFDATLQHQVINTAATTAKLFISRNYDYDNAHKERVGSLEDEEHQDA